MENEPIKDEMIIDHPKKTESNGEKRLLRIGLSACLLILSVALGAYLTYSHVSIRDCQARIDNLPNRNEYTLIFEEVRCLRDEFREFRRDIYLEQHNKGK